MFGLDWEPFNGMAKRPWLMFFGLLFAIAVWLAGCIFLVLSCTAYATEETTQAVEVRFTSYTFAEQDLLLQASNGQTYKVCFFEFYDGQFSVPAAFCDGRVFLIRVTENNTIKAMHDSTGTQYITFASEREAYRNSQRLAIIGLPAALILTVFYFVFSWVVSKNPERYPNWLINLLFEKGLIFTYRNI